MTLRLYAERKSLPLDRVTVTLRHDRIHAEDCESCETREGMINRIDRAIALEGRLDADQRRALKSPAHGPMRAAQAGPLCVLAGCACGAFRR